MRQYCTIFEISEDRKRIGFAEQIEEESRSSVTPAPTTRRKFTRAPRPTTRVSSRNLPSSLFFTLSFFIYVLYCANI
ncbi:hypothetical protein ANCCAN_25333 [Ancylostoma caninum]|uniref:Uncharacterized protein n=1 Tax=Ancylostoma caninum TaxID=29170 RepID=A0A368F9U6_ANCCA|nr:hypothetical protein ANCCAN_25333 [Ancylostoma caninum]